MRKINSYCRLEQFIKFAFTTFFLLIVWGVFNAFEYLPDGSGIEYKSDKSRWQVGSSMKVPRTEGASAVVDDKLYIIGGSDKNQTKVDIVEVYDYVKDIWTRAAPLPAPVYHSGCASYNGKIYVVGGLDQNKQPTTSVFIYDPVTDTWKEGRPLPGARGALTANFINGTLYAVGGINSSHIPVRTNQAYDPITNTWIERASMPTARHHLTSAVSDGKLYVIGGRLLGNGISSHINEALSNLDTNEAYDPINNTWTEMKQMPTKRSGIAASTFPINGSIYVFGGQSLDGAYNNTEKYNPKTNQWTKEQSMPHARLGLEAEIIGDRLFLIGGKEGLSSKTAIGIIDIFFPPKN